MPAKHFSVDLLQAAAHCQVHANLQVSDGSPQRQGTKEHMDVLQVPRVQSALVAGARQGGWDSSLGKHVTCSRENPD